jgi:ribosomal protein L37AE/L43A
MKSVIKWSAEETENLKRLFDTIVFNTHQHSKMEIIYIEHIKCYPQRTQKAIERKLYRLGYTNYTINTERKNDYVCEICNRPFSIPKRYAPKYIYCPECREKHKNDNWKNKKIYMKMYNEKRRNKI